jgi:hypothetical protein
MVMDDMGGAHLPTKRGEAFQGKGKRGAAPGFGTANDIRFRQTNSRDLFDIAHRKDSMLKTVGGCGHTDLSYGFLQPPLGLGKICLENVENSHRKLFLLGSAFNSKAPL